ncbi:MAG: hypothetical protein AAF585_03680 [Verrucomicrobiota bacterium]
MRQFSDEVRTFFDSVQIILQIEEDHAIQIPDSVIESISPWEELTLRNLVTATQRCLHTSLDHPDSAEVAVTTAVEKLFPSISRPIDFDAPLLEAIAPDRAYGESYSS